MENQISGLTKDREAAKVSAAEASAEQRVIKSDFKSLDIFLVIK